MEKPMPNKASRITRAPMTVLTVILIFLFLNIMSLVADIQGTARVVNYAGLVRGTTQRIVKMEDAQKPQDKLIEAVDSYIDGLRYGSDDLGLVRLDDEEFQAKMVELDAYYSRLTDEIQNVRQVGYENTQIIDMSETFFAICDEATKLAENYSQEKATALNRWENVVVVDIAGLLALMGIELARAIRTAAQNRALQKKVYLDEATGLPNKNKCEELLDAPELVTATSPTAVFVFDMNNLRTINNNLGHDKGDEYIRSFAQQLAKVASPTCFVGRDGGDEFIAILSEATHDSCNDLLSSVRANADSYSREHPAMPISYAVGYALSTDFAPCTMRELFRQADKSMYIDKNHAKMREAAERQQENRRLIDAIDARGFHFSDCLYCDAKLDQYRALRASSNAFLASDGSYSGALEEIARELSSQDPNTSLKRVLGLENLRFALTEHETTFEAVYRRENGRTGKITALFIDGSNGELHHFAVGFTPFYETHADEKQQIATYYDQLKHSILENNNFVDAMLADSQAAYSVDFTHDRLEQAFCKAIPNRQNVDIDTPCSYDAYCAQRSAFITADTLESFRLADTSEKMLERFGAGESQVLIEYQEIGRNGEPLWLQKVVLMSHDVAFDSKTHTTTPLVRGIILFRDTSRFHEHEERENKRLEAALDAADSKNREKTEFMNRMSHDFRTPINGIMGMLEIMRANRGNAEKTDECVEKIQLSADHLLALVNDVLDMSKLESGKAAIGHDAFDLEILMGEIHDVMEGQIAESGLVHRSHRGHIEHTKLVGSPLRLRQIMLNLFSNAVKYNTEHGTIDTYAGEIRNDENTATFEFSIADTGVGMSPEFVENGLFAPFSQEANDARTHYAGTGLGMSIVKSLIDAMGGSIQVESELGCGTTFTFQLTFEIDHGSVEESAKADEKRSMSLQGMRVLLVEDNALNMEIAEFYLASAGADVIQAWNGKEALEKFQEATPGAFTCILMDIMMPVMDGLEAAKRIRALDRPDAQTVPIIAMTANAFDEDRQKTRDAGMDGHLVKPIDMPKLLDLIARLSA